MPSHTVQCYSAVFPICLTTLCFSSCLKVPLLTTQSAVIGQLTHAWDSIPHHISSRLCHVFQLLVSFTSAMNIGINYADVWPDLVWCHKVTELKAGLPVSHFRHFRSSVFCGREELPVVWTSGLFNHNKLYTTLKDRKKNFTFKWLNLIFSLDPDWWHTSQSLFQHEQEAHRYMSRRYKQPQLCVTVVHSDGC